jgi:subtilase family serine protease
VLITANFLSADFRRLSAACLRRLYGILLALCLACTGLPAVAAPIDDALRTVAPRARITEAVNDNVRRTLRGNLHPAATAANDVGAADDRLRLERLILLLKADAAQTRELDNFIAATKNRASPLYRQWLTPQRFQQHFGVAAGDIDKVERWLTSHGLTIDELPAGGRSIIFSGTAAQLRSAFRTGIRRYLVDGRQRLANADEPQIPAALADVVDGVVSLHEFHSRPLHSRAQIAPDYTSGGTHYLAANDFHTIYNLNPLYQQGIDGSGRSIAILGRSNVNLADMQHFRAVMGLPSNPPQIIINGADPGLVSGDHGESDLDLEWAGAVAKAATIKFVTSASTGGTDGITLSAQYAVSNNVADVISLSYGLCETSMGPTQRNLYNSLWQQAAALGISVVVSSGDSGAAGCDAAGQVTATRGLGVNGLCSPQYSTCVGGTQFNDVVNPSLYWASGNGAGLGSALSYIREVAWNESGSNGGANLWSTGGGSSNFYTKPSWQTTPGVPATNRRHLPDVSLTAALHVGYLVYSSDNATNTRTLYIFGGTSASAPAFAGILALTNQRTGYRLGNANPTLYGLATRQAANGAPAYFHHITAGNNSVPGLTGFAASPATPYFNQATGLGSVDATVLVNGWTDVLPATTTALTSTPNPAVTGQSVTFTAIVSGTTPTGSVQFADGANALGAPVALTGGIATLATNSLAAGSHAITARYSGDPANQSSVSAVLTQNIQVPTSVSLTSSAPSVTAGQSVTFTATVSGIAPTGSVQFTDGGVNYGAAVPLSGTTAILTTSTLSIGSHSIGAVYAGDAINPGSSAPLIVQTVTGGSPAVPVLPDWALALIVISLLAPLARAAQRR